VLDILFSVHHVSHQPTDDPSVKLCDVHDQFLNLKRHYFQGKHLKPKHGFSVVFTAVNCYIYPATCIKFF